jgi:hypothetical protein
VISDQSTKKKASPLLGKGAFRHRGKSSKPRRALCPADRMEREGPASIDARKPSAEGVPLFTKEGTSRIDDEEKVRRAGLSFRSLLKQIHELHLMHDLFRARVGRTLQKRQWRSGLKV